MMLNSSLDIFEARMPSKTIGHDFGLLHALDERIAMYGWMLNTGVKFVIVVDMEGRTARDAEAAKIAVLGLRERDLTPVSCVLGRVEVIRPETTLIMSSGLSSTSDSLCQALEQPVLCT